jgi:hypothetical protein
MGKRELLIILGFVVAGVALYQFTAPPPTEGRGFSLGRLIDEIRADIRSDAESAEVTHTGTIAVPEHLHEIRLSSVTGRVVVTGDNRGDIEYDLRASATGPDVATATERANQTVLVEDDLGGTLGLRVSYPREARVRTEITLRVPRRLSVRVEGGNSAEFKSLQDVRLEGLVGEVTAGGILGEVGGSHRNGRLTVDGAGSVSLTLVSSRATFSRVAGSIVLNATRGETRVVDSRGSAEIELSSNELHVERHDGPLRVSGQGGEIIITDPGGEVRVDVRRTQIEVTLTRAVPMTIITSEEPLRLLLAGEPAVVVDAAIAGSGSIDADDFGLTATTSQDQTELTHAFGAGATTRVSLRNRRDDIVIRKMK